MYVRSSTFSVEREKAIGVSANRFLGNNNQYK